MKKIPVFEPTIGEEEKKLVISALDLGEISGSFGEYIPKFEQSFSNYCDMKYGITVCNGSIALHLAMSALGIKKGDEVLVSSLTNIASAFCVVYNGAKPVAVDSERETWNMDPEDIEKKITPKTKAIIPVHIYGHPCDMDPIIKIAKKHNLFIVEDCAEAHGAEYKGQKVGSFSDISCFSFYVNKVITTGEGGMLLTNNKELYERAQLLRNLAFTTPRFTHFDLGYNYRMSNVVAAIGCAQVSKIDRIIEDKIIVAKKYNKRLKGIDGITLPPEKPWAKNVYWMYCILVEDNFGVTRDELYNHLKEKGIETRTFFIPINKQPIFQKMGYYSSHDHSCPVAEELAVKGLYLPSSLKLTDADIDYICDAIKHAKK